MSRTKKFGTKWFDGTKWEWMKKRYFVSPHSSKTKQDIQKNENRKLRREEKEFLDNVIDNESTPEPRGKKNVTWQLG